MDKTTAEQKKRTLILFGVFLVLLTVLAFRVGWHQIVKGSEYERKAQEQQKKDQSIESKRGVIKDRNGKDLAISTVSYSVWASEKDMTNTEARKENYNKNLESLAGIIGIEAGDIAKKIEARKGTVKIAKYLNREVADKIKMEGLPGVSISNETKRYYPLGDFGAQLLGSVTDDNNGLSGLELQYNKELKGTNGRWIKNTDEEGKELVAGTEKYHAPIDGYDVVLTIDQAIQYYTEDVVKKAYEKNGSEQVSAIVMNPKTGEILSAATAPSFDPNNARQPVDKEAAELFGKLSEAEQLTYLNQMWRSPLFNDTYEPGSTGKLMTASMALEEGLYTPASSFHCSGVIKIADREIKCWIHPASHGQQTLSKGVANSCNPVHATLATKVGIKKFYDYLDLFGITEYTGIDYPGESAALLQNINTAGPVGIATMGFGQGMATTPIQLITAVSSILNNGNLMQPHLVKKVVDSKGNVISEVKPKIVRKTISEKTSTEMKEIITSVVADGSGKPARIDGYTVGGKTATAQAVVNGKYGARYIVSFLGAVPMEDPEIVILFINKRPANSSNLTNAASIVWEKELMENIIEYLNIKPSNKTAKKTSSKKEKVVIPGLIGKNISEATGILDGIGLKYKVSPKEAAGTDFVIKGQYPKEGNQIEKGGTIYLYKE